MPTHHILFAILQCLLEVGDCVQIPGLAQTVSEFMFKKSGVRRQTGRNSLDSWQGSLRGRIETGEVL